MKAQTSQNDIAHVIEEVEKAGLTPKPLYGIERTVIAVIGDERDLNIGHFKSLKNVDDVYPVLKPYKLVSSESKKERTIIEVNGARIGSDKESVMMAGPCSVESEEQMNTIAAHLKKIGVKIMRGGAFKPRTAPYSFQGLGVEGLKIMREAADQHGLATVTEVMDARQLEDVCNYSDIVQLGARNMQNFELLKELGTCGKPILLKRGLSATIEEFLLAAEYILAHGNPNVILCERGIRTFETDTRNTLPLATVPLVHELSHLPIIVDPTHGLGRKSLIESMSKAAIACGADGLIIETHPNPEKALSDAQQQLPLDEFEKIYSNLKTIADAVGKSI